MSKPLPLSTIQQNRQPSALWGILRRWRSMMPCTTREQAGNHSFSPVHYERVDGGPADLLLQTLCNTCNPSTPPPSLPWVGKTCSLVCHVDQEWNFHMDSNKPPHKAACLVPCACRPKEHPGPGISVGHLVKSTGGRRQWATGGIAAAPRLVVLVRRRPPLLPRHSLPPCRVQWLHVRPHPASLSSEPSSVIRGAMGQARYHAGEGGSILVRLLHAGPGPARRVGRQQISRGRRGSCRIRMIAKLQETRVADDSLCEVRSG